jgi:hypothetical protein
MARKSMMVLVAEKPEDIKDWPCAYSVFTGKSCKGKYCRLCKKQYERAMKAGNKLLYNKMRKVM